MNNYNEMDELFANYVKQAEAEAKKTSNRTSFQKNYEDVKYTGLEKGVASVVRAVGAPIDTNYDDTTAKTVTISKVIGDDGKQFRLIRPSFAQDPNFIINKIISRVKQVKYVNNEKTFPVKDKYPEIWNIIEKNGIQKTDSKYMYNKGWVGSEVVIMNVIDRAQMDWHRENKHTMLLAKSVTEKDGNTFIEEGISAFAAKPDFLKLIKYYGPWEKFDMAITKTGDMNHAYVIENATKTPERVEGPNAKYISMEDHLTDEEKSWERYDLNKLFRTTSNTKIYNRLKGTIARIDAVLNTNFLQELEAEVEKEKVLFEELYGSENKEEETATPITESVDSEPIDIPTYEDVDAKIPAEETPAPVRTRASVIPDAPVAGSDLPYYDTLPENLKDKIISATKLANGRWDIKWNYQNVLKCPNKDCEAVSPMEATVCPACGMKFV